MGYRLADGWWIPEHRSSGCDDVLSQCVGVSPRHCLPGCSKFQYGFGTCRRETAPVTLPHHSFVLRQEQSRCGIEPLIDNGQCLGLAEMFPRSISGLGEGSTDAIGVQHFLWAWSEGLRHECRNLREHLKRILGGVEGYLITDSFGPLAAANHGLFNDIDTSDCREIYQKTGVGENESDSVHSRFASAAPFSL